MQLRYTVTVDIDAAKIESGNPADVVRDEIKRTSNRCHGPSAVT
jgi:hypothetical protein